MTHPSLFQQLPPSNPTVSARNFSLPSTHVQGLTYHCNHGVQVHARLLLRPSHQRTVFRAVNTISCRPLILSSRSYSESTPTPPLPKTSGSTENLRSPGPEDKTCSDSTSTPPLPNTSGSTEGSRSSGPADKTCSNSTSASPFPKSSGSTEGSQSSGPGGKNWFEKALAQLVLYVQAPIYVPIETC